MKNYKVYIHKDKNGDIFYVGCTKSNKRLTAKYYPTAKKHHISIEHFKRCNDIFTVEIVADGLSKEQAYQLEIDLITKYGRIGYEENGILVNKSIGGYSANGLTGRKHTDDRKKEISKQTKGSNNPRSRKVICTITGKIWGCIKDCADDNNINAGTLRNKLNPNCKDRNNTTFKYLD